MLLSRFGAWAVFLVLLGQPDLPQPAEFREHVIEAKIPGGYAVLVRDLNKDGRRMSSDSHRALQNWPGIRIRTGSATSWSPE